MWHDVQQNTDEWIALRSGKLTGSPANKVMANYGKAFGEPAKKLAIDIAVAQITGKPSSIGGYTNEHMARGHEQEPVARFMYESENFVDVTNGGFFDNGFTGDSPDGLVGDDGVIEIKSVIPSVHYLRFKTGEYDKAYHWQLMFHLRECHRDWVDFVSYCADFPENKQLWVQRLYRDDFLSEIKKVDNRVDEFQELVEKAKQVIA